MWLIIEGLDGSGKSTAIEILKEELEKQGKNVVVTRGIGTGEIGSFLRSKIIEEDSISEEMKTLAFPVALLDCLREVKKHLDAGSIVITDRFIGSYWAYSDEIYLVDQIYTFLVEQLYCTLSPTEFKNTHMLYVSSAVEQCIQRISGRENNKYFDNSSEEEFRNVENRYLQWIEFTPKVRCVINMDSVHTLCTRLKNLLCKLQKKM